MRNEGEPRRDERSTPTTAETRTMSPSGYATFIASSIGDRELSASRGSTSSAQITTAIPSVDPKTSSAAAR